MKHEFKIELSINVSEKWIADGFGSDKKELEKTITEIMERNLLTYANYGSEVEYSAKVKKGISNKLFNEISAKFD